jgi:hypothetical protein
MTRSVVLRVSAEYLNSVSADKQSTQFRRNAGTMSN